MKLRLPLLLALLPALMAGAGMARAPAERDAGRERLAPYAVSHPLPVPVRFVEGVVSTGDDESHPTLSEDGRRLYFLKNAANFNHWTIVISTYRDGRWGTPEVAPFSGQFADADVSFSRDESVLYFVSMRPTAPGGPPKTDTDIWRMRRQGSTWGEPERLAEVSSDDSEWYPNVTDSGALYFGSGRRSGNVGVNGSSDLWRARWANGRFGEPENLGPVINTPGNEIEAWVARDESTLIFASNARPDGLGAYDLYVSYNCDGTWTTPRSLGEPINSRGWDFSPRMSPDGKYFFFTSNRSFTDKPLDRRLDYAALLARVRAPGNGLRDIYQVDAAALGLNRSCPPP